MEMGKIASVELRHKRTNILVLPFKLAAILAGVFGYLAGLALTLTVVGAVIGIPMILGAVGVIYKSMNRQQVECQFCHDKHNYVKNHQQNLKCRKCKNLTVVNWIK